MLQPITPINASAGSVAVHEPIEVQLSRTLDSARALSQEATDAVKALKCAERPDVQGVLLASRKADAAYQMLQAVRNAMIEAYRA